MIDQTLNNVGKCKCKQGQHEARRRRGQQDHGRWDEEGWKNECGGEFAAGCPAVWLDKERIEAVTIQAGRKKRYG